MYKITIRLKETIEIAQQRLDDENEKRKSIQEQKISDYEESVKVSGYNK